MKLFHPELLRGCHPQLCMLVANFEAKLSFAVAMQAGARDDVTQFGLWCKGRDPSLTGLGAWIDGPEVDAAHPHGRTVTKARTSVESPHGLRFFSGKPYGCAVDIAPCDEKGRVLWTRNGKPNPELLEQLNVMNAVATRMGGFVWGGTFTSFDGDHWELSDFRKAPPAPLATLPSLTPREFAI